MTRREFDKWAEEWFTAFPDSQAWLNKLPNPAGTLETWFKCLSRCCYADVAEATARIIMGDLQSVEAYQREQTALHIRAYAGRITDDRNKRQKQTREHEKFQRGRERNRNDHGPTMGSMFKAILQFREEAEAQGLEGVCVTEYASEKLEAWMQSNGPAFGDSEDF